MMVAELELFRAEVLSALYDINKKLETIEANTTKKVRVKSNKIGNEEQERIVEQIIEYWNNSFGKTLKNCKTHRNPIIARLKEGYKYAEFEQVICNKFDDPFFKENPKYFMPQTLFGNNMDKYLNCGKVIDSDKKQNNTYQHDLERGLEEDCL